MHRRTTCIATGLLVGAAVACSHTKVSDPSLTAAYTWRDDADGVRPAVGYQVERQTELFGAGATGHVGYDSLDRTPIGWAEGHVTFVVVSVMAGAWGDRLGVGHLYGVAVGWMLPTCTPHVERGGGASGLFAGDVQPCTQRRRLVPRGFYVVENAADGRADRHVIGLEVAGGWW